MIERDNLVRSLGITDLITDMLQSVRTKVILNLRITFYRCNMNVLEKLTF